MLKADRTARKALVTGSSSGIGEAIARRLLHDGWDVLGLDRARPSIDAAKFKAIEVDVTNEVEVSRRVAAEGEVTAVVHAAGYMRVASVGDLNLDDGENMWRVHVHAASILANALAPRLPAGGRIVLIGSRAASGAAGRSQYAATKAALVGMARSWAIELAPRGITAMLRDGARAAVAPRTPPIGRFVRPEEVAALVAFLLSDDAAAITGQQLVICGGSSL
jgi:NAD(P)-dependent dehydrogenase (short-subunit alcohol dehydrogenase family)